MRSRLLLRIKYQSEKVPQNSNVLDDIEEMGNEVIGLGYNVL